MSTYSTLPAPQDPESIDLACGEDEDGSGHECPCCGGPCYVLGSLGNTVHVRCRDCGMTSGSIEDVL
jgi:hypothetical protein